MTVKSDKERSPSELLKLDPLEARRFLDHIPLAERAEFIMRASGRQRQDLILLTSRPEEVVAVFPPEELFFTIKEIGASDAIPLIGLTTPEQLQFMLDVDWWRKDSLRPEKMLEWIQLLLSCGETKVAVWLNTVDFALLVLLFKHYTRVQKPDEDERQELQDRTTFTVDDYYFVELEDPNVQTEFVALVEILREVNPKRYFDLMESATWDIRAENAEDAYHWRRARLEDQGVPTFHDALDVFRPPAVGVERMAREPVSPLPGAPEGPRLPLPVYPLAVSDRPAFVLAALDGIADRETLDLIKRQWAHVCNSVVMADVTDFDDLSNVKKGIQKASRYLNLGLEHISQGRPERAVQVLKTVPVVEIFRSGYAQAVGLKKRAAAMVHKGWVEEDLSPADEPWRSVLAGLLRRHPVYYDPRLGGPDQGDEYRDFGTFEEVRETEERLEEAELVGGRVLERFPDHREVLSEVHLAVCNLSLLTDVTWSVLLFTAVAQNLLKKDWSVRPLTRKELNSLFPLLWTKGRSKTGVSLSEVIRQEMEEVLVGPDPVLSSSQWERIRHYLSICYELIEQEMGFLAGPPVDPRYVHVLLVDMST